MAERRVEKVTLPSEREILVTREFDVPRALVYRAWTTPELVRRWWSGGRGIVTVVEMDLRVGGRWRYVMTTGDGAEVTFSGEYRQVVPDERIVYTEVFDTESEAKGETTVTFSDVDSGSTVTVLVRYENQTDRDAHRRYMADGLADALDLLQHVAEQQRSAFFPSDIGGVR